MRLLKRYSNADWCAGKPFPVEPFVMASKSWDIAHTMARFVENLPPHCAAVALRGAFNYETLVACERAARRKNIRIMWLRTGARPQYKGGRGPRW